MLCLPSCFLMYKYLCQGNLCLIVRASLPDSTGKEEEEEECPICCEVMLPITWSDAERWRQHCCGNEMCFGCYYALRGREVIAHDRLNELMGSGARKQAIKAAWREKLQTTACPFCRAPYNNGRPEDVARGYVSVSSAARDYGVCLLEGVVDEAATMALRAELAANQTTEHFHFGPERDSFETVWTKECYGQMTQLMTRLPVPGAEATTTNIPEPSE